MADSSGSGRLLIEVRSSPIQGMGVFARVPIRAGTRIIEYTGERISNAEADRRYDDDAQSSPHTVLFILNRRTIIDANFGGNESRYINHSCNPNCESLIEDKKVFIEAVREIAAGEELTYDYQLTRDGPYKPEFHEKYACRCGAPNCRGTMLLPPKKNKRRSASRRAAG